MKRTTLFVALASALSLSAYAHDQASKQSSQNEQTEQQSASGDQSSQQGSDLVKEAQQKLNDSGKDVGPVDGKMGPKTQAALTQFQQENGLQASGQLNQETIAALDLDEGSSAATGGTSSTQSNDSGSMGSSNDTSSDQGGAAGSSSPSSDTTSDSASGK